MNSNTTVASAPTHISCRCLESKTLCGKQVTYDPYTKYELCIECEKLVDLHNCFKLTEES